MGGVVSRGGENWQELIMFLGEDPRVYTGFTNALGDFEKGLIDEKKLWDQWVRPSGKSFPLSSREESLLGKFFSTTLDISTREIIKELKARDYQVVCGTNTCKVHYDIHMQLGHYTFFDKVYASHLMGLTKPDPAFYTYILNAEEVKPNDSFFSDDTPINVMAAGKIGIHAFVYTSAASLKEQLKSACFWD
jgi:putative hydrolase of the HAD superfamily